ncbi:MAG TPA: hypothetical protein O0X27_04755, partial [Methanocorpusculum sp.]|nr:hypothetical protein [Methanocorpusculum sp.]
LTAALRESGVDVTTSTRYQDIEDSLLSAFGKPIRKHHEQHEHAHVHGGFGSHPHYHNHSEL